MTDEDYILALQTSVKREVIEHYLRERRILQEEMHMVYEDTSAYHGGLCKWENLGSRLAAVLLTKQAAGEFFTLAGMPGNLLPSLAGAGMFVRPRALTGSGSYRKLVQIIYEALYEQSRELGRERLTILELMKEVNRDITHFELNYDILAITSYLRSMDPQELQKRKILGGNFNASEIAQGMESLSFKHINPVNLEIHEPPPELSPPAKILKGVKDILSSVYKQHPEKVAALWASKGSGGSSLKDEELVCRLNKL